MWTFKTKFLFLLYKMFASWLPCSQRSKFGKFMRYTFAKKIATLGKNVNIERNAYFTPLLKVGNNSGIGINSEIYGPVIIGDNVMMGPEVIIYTSNHKYNDPNVLIMDQGNSETKKVVIEDDCWIGRRAIIMPGVVIGKGSVIGAGAVVTKSVEPYSVSCGVPAKLIKKRK